ncbi:type II toxin-antitoxin system PemK/MazF family toxin [Zafaria cholistanensis]|nr:type II toxin-antitoxin system PemK/MazF family toxin [Zafaria cholistanensis]
MKSGGPLVRTLLDALARLFGAGPARGPGTTQGRGAAAGSGTAPAGGPRPASAAARGKGRGNSPAGDGRPGGGRPGPVPSPRRPARAAGAKPGPQPGSGAGLGGSASWEQGGYPGDFTGKVRARYAPTPDGRPDPGEVVWAWVPYEEDHGQGKDRPVLLVGHDGDYLLALMLTSRDRNNGTRRDGDYLDVGSGPWDRQGRPSEVKLDRVVRLLPGAVRREGAVLDRERFEAVARRL